MKLLPRKVEMTNLNPLSQIHFLSENYFETSRYECQSLALFQMFITCVRYI